MGFELRAAGAGDLAFLSELAGDPLVEPYLAPGSGEPERLEAILAQAQVEDGPGGLFVIQADGAGRLGGLGLAVVSERSRICQLSRLMVSPHVRRTGVGGAALELACRHVFAEHGYHRLQAETYGDNVAGQRLFERAGFVQEGRRRRAYWRRDQWLDGVIYGILAEDLKPSP